MDPSRGVKINLWFRGIGNIGRGIGRDIGRVTPVIITVNHSVNKRVIY